MTSNSKLVRQIAVTGTKLKEQIVEYLSQVDGVKGLLNWLLGNTDTERFEFQVSKNIFYY